MNRPKYKELYIREKGKNKALENEIEYYKQCLKYMSDKKIINYINEVVPNSINFSYIDKTLIEVDEKFRLWFAKEIAIEEYENKEVKE